MKWTILTALINVGLNIVYISFVRENSVGLQTATEPYIMQIVNNKNYQNKIKKESSLIAEYDGIEGGEELEGGRAEEAVDGSKDLKRERYMSYI